MKTKWQGDSIHYITFLLICIFFPFFHSLFLSLSLHLSLYIYLSASIYIYNCIYPYRSDILYFQFDYYINSTAPHMFYYPPVFLPLFRSVPEPSQELPKPNYRSCFGKVFLSKLAQEHVQAQAEKIEGVLNSEDIGYSGELKQSFIVR